MARTTTFCGKLFAWLKTTLLGLAYIAAVLGIAIGGIGIAGWALFRAEESPSPARIELESGLGKLPIPAPAGTSGTRRLPLPPLRPSAYEAWEDERSELERWFPYEANLFLPARNPDLAYACEYYEPLDAASNVCGDVTCRLLVFAEPGDDAAAWDDFRADARTLENDLAEAARKGKNDRLFVGGERTYGYDAAPGERADSARFVWIGGCRFVLRCEHEDLRGLSPDRIPAAEILDAWTDAICAGAGVSPAAPAADEISRGNAWAVTRREAGEATSRALDAAEESGLAGFRLYIRQIWPWIRGLAIVTVTGCLSVTLVWSLALGFALVVFGRKRPANTDGSPPNTFAWQGPGQGAPSGPCGEQNRATRDKGADTEDAPEDLSVGAGQDCDFGYNNRPRTEGWNRSPSSGYKARKGLFFWRVGRTRGRPK